jgi:hypothetical protein
MGTIQKVNHFLASFAERHTRGHYRFLDCSPYFLTEDGSRIDEDLMPDSIQLNTAGGTHTDRQGIAIIQEVSGG